ncbi:MAG: hypothetical protein WC058_16295 [Phycisphaeraceae bacterium]
MFSSEGVRVRGDGRAYRVWAVCVGSIALFAAGVGAGERHFAFTYEVLTHPAGEFEYEQWVTWKASKETDHTFDRFDIRHELEYGVTDHFQIAAYLSDWRYEDGKSVRNDGVDWRGAGLEAIYNFTHPVTDPVGFSVYGETLLADDLFKLEAKLLFQKNIGSWIFAYNFVVEAEWEGYDYEQNKGVFQHIAGITYQLTPRLAAGTEALYEREYDDWSRWGDHVVYLGPAMSYRQGDWWIAVTPLFQVTRVADEPDFQTRLKIGLSF